MVGQAAMEQEVAEQDDVAGIKLDVHRLPRARIEMLLGDLKRDITTSHLPA